jgi:FSR family fosmidomycin resistance protein-like MFS transporter
MEKQNKFRFPDVLLMSLGHFVHDVFSSFLAPILPLLIDKLGMSYSIAGVLSLIQRIPSLFNPLVGLAADKASVKYLLVIAPTLTATSMSLLGVASSVTVLMLLLFFMGVGASMWHTPGPVIVRKVSGSRIGKGMSYFMVGGEIARSVSPMVILGAVSLWGLEGTYRLIPFGLLMSIVLFIRLKNIEITGKKKERVEKGESVKKTITNITPLFLTIAGLTFFLALMKGALTAFLPTFITSKGESLWAGGIALTSLQISGAVGSFLAGTFSDKFGRRKILLIISIVAPLLMILFNYAGDVYAVPILLVLGIFSFGTTPVILAIVNDNASSRPSFINGVYITLNFVIGGGSVFLVGLLGDLFGLFTTYRIVGFTAFLAIPFVLLLKRYRIEK